MRILRRVRVWFLPTLVIVNVVLVWSDLLTAREAVLIAAGLELCVWLSLLFLAPRAIRSYRSNRSIGTDRWLAAERALSELMPARMARWVLYDPRIWVCLVKWARNRRNPLEPNAFAYHSNRRTLTVVFLGILAFDTVMTHLVLAVIFGNKTWIWLLTALDVYTVLWIGGLWASYVVLPHRVTGEALHLRLGFVDDLVVPLSAIRSTRRQIKDETMVKRMRVDLHGAAMFSCGEANVALQLDPAVTLLRRGAGVEESIRTLHITADDPNALLAQLRPAAARR